MRYMFFFYFYDAKAIMDRKVVDKKWFSALDEINAHMSADEYAYEHGYAYYELVAIQVA